MKGDPHSQPGAEVPHHSSQPAHPQMPSLKDFLGEDEWEHLSTLQILDLIVSQLPPASSPLEDLKHLRSRIVELEEITEQSRQALEKFDAIVEKLRKPALRIGTVIGTIKPDLAHVALGGGEYICQLDEPIQFNELQIGQRVLCNEAFCVVSVLGFDPSGPIVKIDELLSDGRLRVGNDLGAIPHVLLRSSLLAKEKLKPGLEIRTDPQQRVALEVLGMGRRVERSLETVQEVPWSSIGGQDEAVQAIRETIELPLLHRSVYQRYKQSIPKGFLLHGPPGCGKTLLGKATAHNLRQQLHEKTGINRPDFFLHIKGPEILNMWVGESERQVRDLFIQCREKAKEGAIAFLFIDEAESILGTRQSGRSYNILSTLVPMFCTEMDGLEVLENVVIILASNRADLIDPAILRPGRIDRKIKVKRPDLEGARTIYNIYLSDDLPTEEPRANLIQAVLDVQYSSAPDNQILEVVYRNGKKETLHRGDLTSGAIIASIVDRAKSFAIKRAIASQADAPITREDLIQALQLEFRENEFFPSSDITEDWMKLTDLDPTQVVKLIPLRTSSPASPNRRSLV